MATEVFADLAQTVVTSGGTTAPASGTSETWTVATPAAFPSATTGVTQFHIRDPNLPSELILATNTSGATLTVTRGDGGTTPVAHAAGFTVWQVTTAGVLGSFAQLIIPSGDTTGATDSAAIAAALSEYGAACLAAGQFWAYGLVLGTGQWITGQGEQATVISLPAGQARLLSSQNFASLTKTGTVTSGVPYNFGWRNLTRDGNGASQSAQLGTPSAPAVANAGTTGSTSYTYRVTWVSAAGETVGSAAGTTATGNATLDSANYNTVTRPGPPPSGATGWNVYAGGRGQEVLCNASPVATATTTYPDQGTRQVGVWAAMPRVNTTGGILVAVYGYGFQACQFTIHNGAGLGLWTEWAPAAQTSQAATDQMEALLADFKIHNCDGGAWEVAGTHDLQANDFICSQNCSGAGYATIFFPGGNLAGGATLRQYHIWGADYDYCIFAGESGLELDGQAEGGLLAELFINASQNRVSGKLFDSFGTANTATGLVLGPGVNNVDAWVRVEGCGGAVFDATGFGGDCYLRLYASYYGSQAVPSPLYLGTLDANSVLDLHVITTTGAVAPGSGLTRQSAAFTTLAVAGSLTIGAADVAAGIADAIEENYASTYDTRGSSAGQGAVFAAGYAYYGAFIGYGQTVSSLRISVGTSSGSISVGTYGSGGQSGASRLPAAQKSTSGAVPCPATGLATVSLLAPVTIARGDYGAISCDNTTATFNRNTPDFLSAHGVAANQSSAHPLPSPAAAANGGGYLPWVATP